MNSDNLENYYPGDANWHRFAILFVDEWSTCQFQNELLLAVDNDKEIAMVVYASVWQSALEWIDEPVPALGNITPGECMKTDNGRRRLRTMLMRMPR